jgi:hypothetical protein
MLIGAQEARDQLARGGIFTAPDCANGILKHRIVGIGFERRQLVIHEFSLAQALQFGEDMGAGYNDRMPRLIVFVWIFLLTACGANDPIPPDLSPVILNPYPSPTITPAVERAPSAAPILIPTPTPFPYTIALGDNLTSLAKKFNVTVDDLLAANPAVYPQALRVGDTLNIPSVSANSTSEPAPTPAVSDPPQADCYPSADQGLWCLALIENPYPEPLENITAQIDLIDASGASVVSRRGVAPLNILPAGKNMPIGIFFPVPINGSIMPRVNILTAIRLTPDDARYIPAQAENVLVSVDWSGRAAEVSGEARLLKNDRTAKQVWVLAVAYSAGDRALGFRRWEWSGDLTGAGALPFRLSVYSLGGGIARVDVIVEARP